MHCPQVHKPHLLNYSSTASNKDNDSLICCQHFLSRKSDSACLIYLTLSLPLYLNSSTFLVPTIRERSNTGEWMGWLVWRVLKEMKMENSQSLLLWLYLLCFFLHNSHFSLIPHNSNDFQNRQGWYPDMTFI